MIPPREKKEIKTVEAETLTDPMAQEIQAEVVKHDKSCDSLDIEALFDHFVRLGLLSKHFEEVNNLKNTIDEMSNTIQNLRAENDHKKKEVSKARKYFLDILDKSEKSLDRIEEYKQVIKDLEEKRNLDKEEHQRKEELFIKNCKKIEAL